MSFTGEEILDAYVLFELSEVRELTEQWIQKCITTDHMKH